MFRREIAAAFRRGHVRRALRDADRSHGYISNPLRVPQGAANDLLHKLESSSHSALDQAIGVRLRCIDLRILPCVLQTFVPTQI